MKRLLLLVTAVLATPATGGATPRTINVPQDYSTITAAITAAKSGDTILLGPGTYNQFLQDWGFHDKIIALRSVGGPAVTTLSIAGSGHINVSGASEISGFTISGGNNLFSSEAFDVTGDGTLFRGNIFENIVGTRGFAAAIFADPGSPIIDGNIFRNNATDLVQESGGIIRFANGGSSGRYSSPTIVNNLFINNPSAAAIQITSPSGNQPVVINNTFVNNAIGISYASFSPAVIRNNIFANNAAGFHFRSSIGTDPFWDHNLLFNSGPTYGAWMGTNIESDPLFVNGADFHLQPGSPAIGDGYVPGAPTHDFYGVSRSSTSNDLGALTFVPEPSTMLLLGVLAPLALRRDRTLG